MRIMRDLYAHKFGRLVALYPMTERDKSGHVVWMCRCDCGNLVEIRSYSLIRGGTKSCGCLKREKAGQQNITHGDATRKNRLRIYRAWKSIKHRCLNPNASEYKYYGGRGIAVCKEWINSYQRFKFWALLSGYADNLTIDRIDNDGNYEPDNCQWITQSENTRKRFQ